MKPNWISIKSTDKLAAAIKAAEGRATVRTITPDTITRILAEVDDHLKLFSTRKDAIGTLVDADPCAQTFPNAYKYIPESTHFTAILTTSGWKVTQVFRHRTYGPTQRIELTLTAATKAGMVRKLSTIR